MMKLIAVLIALASTVALGQFTPIQRAELRDVNIQPNPGFEAGKTRWTASGGSTALVTAGSNLGAGSTSLSWDASGAQTLTGTLTAVPAGFNGQRCRVSTWWKGGDTNLTLQAWDGTSVLATYALSASTNWTLAETYFPCPSSGSMTVRISAAADAAIAYFDQTFIGVANDGTAVSVSPKVYTQSKTAIIALGTSGFNAAGHTLVSSSFPVTTGKIAFYNGTSASDNSGALSCSGSTACNLTNNGSVPFTGTGYAGASNTAATFNGSTQSLSSTDAFFNPGNTKSFGAGCWVKATNWSSGSQMLISNETSATDRGYYVYLNNTGQVEYSATNTAAGADFDTIGPTHGWTNGTWHHVAFVYDQSAALFKLYLDGKLSSQTALANQRSLTASNFRFGAYRNAATAFFTGSLQDCFFHNAGAASGALTDDDIRRLYSRKIDHNKSVIVENQIWSANWYRSDSSIANQLTSAWLVHKDTNSVWADFSDVAVGAFVDLSLQNTGMTPQTLPVFTYDSGWLSSTPGTSITHGLPDFPQTIRILYEGDTANAYEELPSGSFCSGSSTALTCDWTGLTVSSSNRIRIIASSALLSAAAIDAASATNVGLVSTGTQTFAGDKTINGKLGVNSLAPNAPLTVRSNGSNVIGGIEIDGLAASSSPRLVWTMDNNASSSQHWLAWMDRTNGNFRITQGTNNAADGTDAVVIDTNGSQTWNPGSQTGGSAGSGARALLLTPTADSSSVYGGIVWSPSSDGVSPSTEGWALYGVTTGGSRHLEFFYDTATVFDMATPASANSSTYNGIIDENTSTASAGARTIGKKQLTVNGAGSVNVLTATVTTNTSSFVTLLCNVTSSNTSSNTGVRTDICMWSARYNGGALCTQTCASGGTAGTAPTAAAASSTCSAASVTFTLAGGASGQWAVADCTASASQNPFSWASGYAF